MNGEAQRGATASVLLIENDAESLAIFERILRENCFDVRTANSAEAGLVELQAASVAAIVLDLHLPALDGLECLRRIRAMPPHAQTPVTVITADYLLDDNVIARVEALGARLCFKPIWAEDLLHIVRGERALAPALSVPD